MVNYNCWLKFENLCLKKKKKKWRLTRKRPILELIWSHYQSDFSRDLCSLVHLRVKHCVSIYWHQVWGERAQALNCSHLLLLWNPSEECLDHWILKQLHIHVTCTACAKGIVGFSWPMKWALKVLKCFHGSIKDMGASLPIWIDAWLQTFS